MKIAVVSNDFKTITGKAGRARRFLIYDVNNDSGDMQLLEKLEVADTEPTYHDLHDDDTTPHPVDGMVLITGEAGIGFSERLGRRGTIVYITSETDPETAIQGVFDGSLPLLPATPHRERDGDSC